MLYTVNSVSKRSIISRVYLASSMRSAKLFWVSKPKKLNKINKKAAREGSFFSWSAERGTRAILRPVRTKRRWVSKDVIGRVETVQTLNLLCTYPSAPRLFAYNSVIEEFDHILISLLLFNKVDKPLSRCCLAGPDS